nr:MAG TPA: hypothetical protein [Caudoviricetes sp.]
MGFSPQYADLILLIVLLIRLILLLTNKMKG